MYVTPVHPQINPVLLQHMMSSDAAFIRDFVESLVFHAHSTSRDSSMAGVVYVCAFALFEMSLQGDSLSRALNFPYPHNLVLDADEFSGQPQSYMDLVILMLHRVVIGASENWYGIGSVFVRCTCT
jgi:hypothetical protein